MGTQRKLLIDKSVSKSSCSFHGQDNTPLSRKIEARRVQKQHDALKKTHAELQENYKEKKRYLNYYCKKAKALKAKLQEKENDSEEAWNAYQEQSKEIQRVWKNYTELELAQKQTQFQLDVLADQLKDQRIHNDQLMAQTEAMEKTISQLSAERDELLQRQQPLEVLMKQLQTTFERCIGNINSISKHDQYVCKNSLNELFCAHTNHVNIKKERCDYDDI